MSATAFDPAPPVNCRYGAPMGRRSNAYLETCAGRLRLVRVPLDAGGYDKGGAYWGLGEPLYCVADQDGNTAYLRAKSREYAKSVILADWPEATFYR
ncbi:MULTISPECIES: hypothetical protein [unclassified Xanthobacter]|uniref:hypothetical protein n=1 Tax=unclassified Xanthobacter TaxID=2623496 RepID=UPI001F3A867F|nr:MULTISPECIES: hypothetical protein [unclassified Xanthobacter]